MSQAPILYYLLVARSIKPQDIVFFQQPYMNREISEELHVLSHSRLLIIALKLIEQRSYGSRIWQIILTLCVGHTL